MQAFSARRPQHAHEARVVPSQVPSQPQAAPQSRIPVRERAPSSFPAGEHEWDVPAFQRRQQ
jgi:hypothetical protein